MTRPQTRTLLFAGAALVAGSALAALTTTAGAGILDPAPAYPVRSPNLPPVYDWTGFYVGLSGGATFGSTKWESDPDVTEGRLQWSSGLIGGTIGYNMQTLGAFVVSEEFDFSWRRFNLSVPAATCMPSCTLNSNWVSTARLRFGYSLDRFLPYATFGLSMSDFNAAAAGAPFGPTNNVTFNWVAGVGVEFVIAGPWSAKLEYLFANHTRFVCDLECNGPVNLGSSENIIRVGINYRLGGW
jgi:outer membrane immunogenic protein